MLLSAGYPAMYPSASNQQEILNNPHYSQDNIIFLLNSFLQRNRVFATNYDFIIHLPLQPLVVDFQHFKLRNLLDQII